MFGRARLGFRVPTIVASPFTRGEADDPRVSHLRCDHTSILKLIEWRFGLSPLTARDAFRDVGNLARVLRFGHPCVEVPDLPQPSARRPRRAFADPDNCWSGLRDSGRLEGWDLAPW